MYFEAISAAFKNRGDQEELVKRIIAYYEDAKELKERIEKGQFYTTGAGFSILFKYFVDYMVQYSGEKNVNTTSISKGVNSMLVEYYDTEDSVFNNRMHTIMQSLEKLFDECCPAGVETVGTMLSSFCIANNINPLYLLICYDNKAHELLG